MRMISTNARQPQTDCWCVVYVPGWSESGFDVAEFRNGFWFNQNGQLITIGVEAWVYSDDFKTP
ncbi:hypothetical protein [Siphonobacter sp. SORGH_AS_0500]|uniref:hypothetical protein n=1 Tax=Siphonobacter sp. SORGH_AS_0500 TaxID=1864824 RepID=UPI002863F84B|nr:hypothetical protein [Siphonobacter sp. SORGH_AS_0500]MDR6195938.1 hypothetical protein [Siphonobacter sp. SORGH_AS_0500]